MLRVTVVGEHLDLFDGSMNFVLFKIDSRYDTKLVRKRCYYFADDKILWEDHPYIKHDDIQLISKNKTNLTKYSVTRSDTLFSTLMQRDVKEAQIIIAMQFKPFYTFVSRHTVKLAGTEDDQKFKYASSNWGRDPENSLKYLKQIKEPEKYYRFDVVYLNIVSRLEKIETFKTEIKNIFNNNDNDNAKIIKDIEFIVSDIYFGCHMKNNEITENKEKLDVLIENVNENNIHLNVLSTKLIQYYFVRKDYDTAFKLLKEKLDTIELDKFESADLRTLAFIYHLKGDEENYSKVLFLWLKRINEDKLLNSLKTEPNNEDLKKYALYLVSSACDRNEILKEINPENTGELKNEIEKVLFCNVKELEIIYNFDEAIKIANSKNRNIIIYMEDQNKEERKFDLEYIDYSIFKNKLIPVLVKENKKRIIEKYSIKNFPVYLILDKKGEEIDRKIDQDVDGEYITKFLTRIFEKDKSIRTLQRRYDSGERSSEVYKDLVINYLRRKHNHAALKYSNEMLEKFPDLPEAKVCRAMCLIIKVYEECDKAGFLDKESSDYKEYKKLMLDNYHLIKDNDLFLVNYHKSRYLYQQEGEIEKLRSIFTKLAPEGKSNRYGFIYVYSKTGAIGDILKLRESVYPFPRNYRDWVESIKDKPNAKEVVIAFADFIYSCSNLSEEWFYEFDNFPDENTKTGIIDKLSGKEVEIKRINGILCFVLPDPQNYYMKRMLEPVFGFRKYLEY